MLLLRAYIVAGLLIHKIIWEVLRQRSATRRAPARSNTLRLVKLLKLAILFGVVVQTVFPRDILPIAQAPTLLRVVGVVVYSAGLLCAVLGRFHLGDNWSNIESPRVERHAVIVSNGIYKYIRHPIYLGDLTLLLGLELCLNSWLVCGVALLASVVVHRAILEEKILVQRLPGYASYLQRTKRFIPFVV